MKITEIFNRVDSTMRRIAIIAIAYDKNGPPSKNMMDQMVSHIDMMIKDLETARNKISKNRDKLYPPS